MKVHIVRFSLIMLVTGLLFTGCETYQAYQGPALPRERVAILKCVAHWRMMKPVPYVMVEAVDGTSALVPYRGSVQSLLGMKSQRKHLTSSIELLPGHHTVSFIPVPLYGETVTTNLITENIYVEAGKTYNAKVRIVNEHGTYHGTYNGYETTSEGQWIVNISEEQ